jgi:hypothetical protein
MNTAVRSAFAALSLVGAVQMAQAAPEAATTTTTTTKVTTTSVATTEVSDYTANHNGLNIAGEVGNPLFPTAQIPARGSWRVQGNYFDLGNVQDVKNDYEADENFGDSKFYGIHVAGRPWQAPLELSVGVDKMRARGRNVYDISGFTDDVELDDLDRAGVAVGAKYLFTNESDPAGVRIAAGAGYSQALLKNIHAYVVASKTFNVGHRNIVAHLGGRYDRFKFEGNINEFDGLTRMDIPFQDTSSKFSLFGGVEVPIDRQGRWSLIGEAGTRNSDFDFDFFPNLSGAGYTNSTGHLSGGFPYSLSIRYADNGWGITAGIMRQGLVDDSGLFAQVGKTF